MFWPLRGGYTQGEGWRCDLENIMIYSKRSTLLFVKASDSVAILYFMKSWPLKGGYRSLDRGGGALHLTCFTADLMGFRVYKFKFHQLISILIIERILGSLIVKHRGEVGKMLCIMWRDD